ncbi:electron transfer flavoprotein subunit beta/FixA family protein [Neobacillus bataviensis]|uniref:electron transfer flavoprotein subunit beta/FixA family protein n=1 Tax=Neobacillus bataviensis TaxID=220685 RepID=UPI001CBAB180|nr:electron transfer flavoprotein subunit beta/FixA family protein [Neobacillus bataviensis]
MKILVLIKQTFDIDENIVLQFGMVKEEGVTFITNPYDEYLIEKAIQLREAHGGEVTVITVGSERAKDALHSALARGVNNAVLVNSEDLNIDEYCTAKILSTIIKNREYDIIFVGNVGLDYGSGQIGPRLAEELNIPQVTAITNLKIDGNTAIIERDAEGDKEIVQVSLPVLVTSQQILKEPRYPTIQETMKSKPIELIEIDDLNIYDVLEVKTISTETFFPPEKGPGRILNGNIKAQVSELAELLCREAKII